MNKSDIVNLKSRCREIQNLPVTKIANHVGTKSFEIADRLNEYRDLPESKLRRIEEYLSSINTK